jgi:hypothetical protein
MTQHSHASPDATPTSTPANTRTPTHDLQTERRAPGDCPPKDWGFILDDARIERLRALLAGREPLPAWARRECQRYRIAVPRNAAAAV